MDTQEKNIFLTKLSLIVLITGIIVGILSFLINNVIGIILISISLIFSLILGIISWEEKMSKNIVIISSIIITILILVSAFMFFSVESQNNIRKNEALELLQKEHEIQQLRNNNCLVEYLTQSEIQYETDTQKHIIINALNDILTLSIDELKNKKYPNYLGEKNQWDLPTFISKYFIPIQKSLTLGDNFYTNIRRKEVQEIIKDLIVHLKINNKKKKLNN